MVALGDQPRPHHSSPGQVEKRFEALEARVKALEDMWSTVAIDKPAYAVAHVDENWNSPAPIPVGSRRSMYGKP